MSERFDVRTITAAGTLDFIAGRPSQLDRGFSFQWKPSTNARAQVLATNLDPSVVGNFVDVTSLFTGGAQLTVAGWYRPAVPVTFGVVRFNVDSVTAAGNVLIAGAFAS